MEQELVCNFFKSGNRLW